MNITIKTTAKIGGFLYLVNIVFGIFAIAYVTGIIVIPGNVEATAQNIISHEMLYRLGLTAHIIILITNVPLAIIFYRLFKMVNRTAAILIIFFTLLGTAIEGVGLINQFAPLVILKNGDLLNAFKTDQLQSLTSMFLKLQTVSFNIALIFFGCYCMLMGFLIYQSTFLPKIIGVFIAIGGGCYIFNSFANILDPVFAAQLAPLIQLPSGLGEISFCLYLLFVGVRESSQSPIVKC